MAESRIGRILTSPFRRVKAAGSAFAHPNSLTSFLLPGSRMNYQRSVGDGTTSSVVMAPLRWLQRNSTQAPIRVSVKTESDGPWTPIEPGDKGAGRMLRMLDQPNPFYDGDALEEATTLSEELDGNAYWRKVRNATGAVMQLWWIPHTMIEPKRREGSSNFIDYYEYNPGSGTVEEIPVEDVVHFRIGIDPANTMKGLSPLKSVLREVFSDNEAATYTAALLKNMGVPGVVMTPKGDDQHAAVFGEELAETKAKLEAAITGDNRGRSLVLDGSVELHTVGFNPQQMSVRELRRIPEERVTAVMGVPAIVANLGAGLDRSTFANMAEAREAAAEEALIPRWRRRARTVKHQLLPEFEGNAEALRVDHDLTQVRLLQEDEDKKADRNLRLFQGGAIELAELRQDLGKPVDDSHRIYLRPLASVEVPAGMTLAEAMPTPDSGAAVAADVAQQQGAKAGRVLSSRNEAAVRAAMDALREVLRAAGIDPDDGASGKARWGMLHVADAEVKRLSRLQQARLIQALDKDARALEAVFAKRLVKKFDNLGKHVAEVWTRELAKSLSGDGVKDEGAVTPGEFDAAMRTIALAEVAKWQKTQFTPEYGRHYDSVARQTLKTLTATLGIEWGEREDEIAVRVLQLHGKQVGLVDLAAQTKSALFSALADGKQAGEGADALERRIREYVTNGSAGARVDARALRIARTETMNAQRVSTREAYQASGVYDAVVAWDDRLGYGDEDCVARNGQVFTFDDAEAEEAEEHPNGTLSWAPTTMSEES